MNKFAQIRNQEVRGILSALVDSGHVKCASREAFDGFAERVCEKVGFEYDLPRVIDAAGEVIDEVNGGYQTKTASMQKNAAQIHESNCYAALGELVLMKSAGLIDDQTFMKQAEVLTDAASEAAGISEAVSELPEEVQDAVVQALIEEALEEEAAGEAAPEVPAA